MGPAAIPRHQAHPREDASFEPTRLRKVGVRMLVVRMLVVRMLGREEIKTKSPNSALD